MSQNMTIYEPLEADEIRLFELHHGPPDSPIHGTLQKYKLPSSLHAHTTTTKNGPSTSTPQATSYSALSYTWGTDPPSPTINLYPPSPPPPSIPPSAPYHLQIKPNLHSALTRLRTTLTPTLTPTSPPLRIWVDAICIHQPNTPEKNSQVSKMAQIYNLATTVLVWLGPSSPTSTRAINFISRLQKLEDFDLVTCGQEVVGDWEALHELMNRAWFSRRWIVQEISLARRAVLYCGDGVVEWGDFAAATALFAARHRELGKLFRGSREFGHRPDYLGEVEGLGAKSLVDITTNLFRKNEEGVVLERLLSLEALISTLTLFEAASPHDIIFSVLWLSADAEPDAKDSGAYNFDPLVRTPTQSPEIDIEATQLDTQLQSQLPWDQGHRWHSPGNGDLDDEVPNPPNTQDDHNFQATQYSQMAPPSQHINAPRRRNTFLKPPAPRRVSRAEPARSASDISKLTAEIEFADQPHALDVDYDKDVYEVYKQFLEFAMNRSRSLDILCHPWAPELPSLPSWIPQLSSAPFERKPGSNAFARVRADSLVGRPGLVGSRTYNASGKTKIYPPKGFIQGRTLIATGFVLDAIKVKKSPAVEGIIPSSWLDLVDWKGPPDPVPERFWRTLCADRGPDGQKYPPAYFANACSYVYSKRSRRGNLNTTEMLSYGNCPSIAAEFLRRVREVVWDRMLVLTEGRKGSKKLLALVPAEAEEGDLISIIYGCSVPVVLRRLKKRKATNEGGRSVSGSSSIMSSTESLPPISLSTATTSTALSDSEARLLSRDPPRSDPEDGEISALPMNLDSPHQYTFIGECFVHGMMGGEGFKHQADHKNKLRAFHIV